MHACPRNHDDATGCNAWCDPAQHLHVDLAYADRPLPEAEACAVPQNHHTRHRCVLCRILAVAPAPEAPPSSTRYGEDVRDYPYAYRVTYHVPSRPEEEPAHA